MKLNDKEIIELIEAGASNDILLARKKAAHRNMHVTGKGMTNYLEKLDDYETEAQKIIRTKLAKSNRSNFSFILQPTNKIFTAKGGSVNYNLDQEKIDTLKSKISNISDGLNIRKYLKKKVFKEYVVDPNSVLFVDLNNKGELETHVETTNNILWYKPNGNRVEAIIFEFTEKPEDKIKFLKNECSVKDATFNSAYPNGYFLEKKYYRVIDDVSDRIFVKEKRTIKGIDSNSEIVEDKSKRLKNFFGYVPAIILGDTKDNNTNLFESIIEDLLDDADILLRRMSVMNIHELAHLYPRYWSYAQECTRCEGEGEIKGSLIQGSNPPEYKEASVCSSCGGRGHKTRTNPSDEIVVPMPSDGDPVLSKLLGFESPDLQTAIFYDTVIKSQRTEMFKSMWGTTHESSGKRETATGRFIDVQPVNDKLEDMSDTFANLYRFLLDCYGAIVFNNKNYKSSVSLGNRYIFESADEVLVKYKEISSQPVSEITKVDLQRRYYEAEYQNDPVELKKKIKLMKIEPFPSLSCEKVVAIDFLADIDKMKKVYFAEWSNTLKDEECVLKTEEELSEMLSNYILTKTIKKVENEQT